MWQFPFELRPSRRERWKLSRDTPQTSFRHFPLSSVAEFFVASPPTSRPSLVARSPHPALSHRFTRGASTYFTARNSKKAERKRGSSLPRSRGCSVVYNGVEKMDYTALKFRRRSLSSFSPVKLSSVTRVSIVPRSYRRPFCTAQSRFPVCKSFSALNRYMLDRQRSNLFGAAIPGINQTLFLVLSAPRQVARFLMWNDLSTAL